MKNFKRLVAGAIAATMALALSVSAFAEVEVTSNDGITYASAAATYAPTITAKDGTQMTVVLFDATKELANLKGEDLLYINQDEEGKLSLTSMGTKVDLLEANEDGSAKYAGEYLIRVGYYDTEGNWKVAEGNFTVATKQTSSGVKAVWGDITGDNQVNMTDALAALKKDLGTNETYVIPNGTGISIPVGNAVKVTNKSGNSANGVWGDITGDNQVNMTDALAALKKDLGTNETYVIPNGTGISIPVGDEVTIEIAD